jgi:hypothetical protein
MVGSSNQEKQHPDHARERGGQRRIWLVLVGILLLVLAGNRQFREATLGPFAIVQQLLGLGLIILGLIKRKG